MKATEEEIEDMFEYAEANDRKTCWLGLLKKDGDHYSVLVYAYKKIKKWEKGKLRLAMLLRSDENSAYWSFNIKFTYGLGGYFYDFSGPEDVTDSNQFCYLNRLDKWKTNPRVEPVNDWDAVLKEGNPDLAYLNNIDSILLTYFGNKLITGMKTILTYPKQIELLQKLHFLPFVTNGKALDMDPKELRKCIAYAQESNGIDFTDIPTIQWNMKNGFAPKNAYNFQQRITIGKIRKKIGEDASVPEAIEIYKYLRRDGRVFNYDITEYFEYINLRKELGLDLEDHSARFPSDLERAYSALMEERRKRHEAREKEIIKKSKPFLTYLDSICDQISSKTYSLYHPRTDKQFKWLGKMMHNCVGSMGYHRKQMLGGCAIFGIKKNGKLYACLELCPSPENKAEIEQLYLAHNQLCDAKTRQFVKNKVIPKIIFPDL